MSFIKLFFQILKRNKLMIIVSGGIAIFFTLLFMSSFSLEEYKPKLTILDKDNTKLSSVLKEEILASSESIELKEEKSPRDAIIENIINVYVEIPEGFEEKFLKGEEAKIKEVALEDSQSKTYVDSKVNSFMNNANIYLQNSKGNLDLFYESIEKDDSLLKLDVRGLKDSKEEEKIVNRTNAFNYMSYSVFFGVGSIVAIFFIEIRKKEIKNRYTVAPISSSSYLLQTIVSNIMFVVAFIAVAVLVVAIGIVQVPIDMVFWLCVLNLVCYGIFATAFGLLIGMLTQNKEFANALVTSVSLVVSFLGGLFVPLSAFGENIKIISSFTPAYWYEKAVIAINTTGNLDLGSIFGFIGIELVFCIAIFAIIAVVNKQKMSAEA